jgi:hypothetical protein
LIQPIEPVSIGGFATLAVTNSSVAISTATAGPGSGSYPSTTIGLPNGVVTLINSPDSAGNMYVGALGGTVTTANGVPLAPGQWMAFNIGGGTTPTVIATTTATLVVLW